MEDSPAEEEDSPAEEEDSPAEEEDSPAETNDSKAETVEQVGWIIIAIYYREDLSCTSLIERTNLLM